MRYKTGLFETLTFDGPDGDAMSSVSKGANARERQWRVADLVAL